VEVIIYSSSGNGEAQTWFDETEEGILNATRCIFSSPISQSSSIQKRFHRVFWNIYHSLLDSILSSSTGTSHSTPTSRSI
jgi:hypothetical protein